MQNHLADTNTVFIAIGGQGMERKVFLFSFFLFFLILLLLLEEMTA